MLMATMSCNHFTEKKTPGHDLVVRVVSSLARVAGHDVSHRPTTLVALTMAIGLTPRIGVLTSHVFLAPKITLTSLWTSHAPRLSLPVLSKSHLGTLKL